MQMPRNTNDIMQLYRRFLPEVRPVSWVLQTYHASGVGGPAIDQLESCIFENDGLRYLIEKVLNHSCHFEMIDRHYAHELSFRFRLFGVEFKWIIHIINWNLYSPNCPYVYDQTIDIFISGDKHNAFMSYLYYKVEHIDRNVYVPNLWSTTTHFNDLYKLTNLLFEYEPKVHFKGYNLMWEVVLF